MSHEPASFRPVAAVQDVLDHLSEQGMGWIASEIVEYLQDGNSAPENEALFGVKRRLNPPSHATLPFDGDEQMRITLLTIIRYAAEVYDTWNSAIQRLQKALRDPSLHVVITLPESEEALPMFSAAHAQQIKEVIAWARSRWPDGPEDFDQTLAQLRGAQL